jgi:Family of unknown function (DUF6191)
MQSLHESSIPPPWEGFPGQRRAIVGWLAVTPVATGMEPAYRAARWRYVSISLIVFMTIPGLVILLVVAVAIDRMGLWSNRRLRLPWRTELEGRALSAPGLDEMHAIFYAAKRHEIDQRRTSLMLRDEENSAAPPRTGIDLDGGMAVIRRTGKRQS